MKFGKAITSHQVPEWSSNYMNYKDLKKQIKLILEAQKNNESASSNSSEIKTALAGFFFSIDRNIEKVDDFYNKQYTEYDRRVRKLSAIITAADLSSLDSEELEEIVSVLVELRSSLRNLKWFGELNKRGFVKILKKLDKKVGTSQQQNYLVSRIYPLSFANEAEILKNLSVINDHLNKISPYIKEIESNPSSRAHSVSPDKFLRFISKDDGKGLVDQLTEQYTYESLIPVKLLIQLLNKSAVSQSLNCVTSLLQVIPSLSDPSDISARNFFHHHVITLGKHVQKVEESLALDAKTSLQVRPASPPDANQRLFNSFGPDGINSNDSPTSLKLILQNLPAHLRPALLQKDHYKRTPLHYAAQYGLREITSIIIDCLKSWNEWNPEVSIDDLNVWGDSDDLSPLHLAVLGRHPKTVDTLLSSSNCNLKDSKILLLAARLNSPVILESLLNCKGIDINYVDDEHHETALYISAKLNFIESVKFLLEKGADTEIGENSFGWTPIFISAVEGFGEIIELLKQYGADYSTSDDSGWTPMEHACLRGHLDLADALKPTNYDPMKLFKSPNSSSSSINEVNSSSIEKVNKKSTNDLFKHIRPKLKVLQQEQHLHPIKSFGHRFLQDESMIIITLGSNDTRNSVPILKLDRVPISKIHSTELDTALSLVISTKNKNEIDGIDDGPVVIDLPLDDVDPITIRTKNSNPEEEIIFFDIVPTYGAQHKQILGRAVALLDHVYTKIGNNRTNLNKLVTIPIIETETLDILGTISFEVLIVKPFHHPNMNLNRTEAYWKSLVTTRVIGHRGLGKNISTSKSLQLGENTVESFIAAASLGASYVEFDVQLTKDSEPVVYHDFLVAESGIDVPMHELTLEQFMSFNQIEAQHERKTQDDGALLKSKSAQYFNGYNDPLNLSMSKLEKMKLTKTYKSKGFKGNSRGSSIASSFVTLKELFKKIPKSVGFNIECKYPLLYESEVDSLGDVAIEINHWVDTILKVVYDCANGRDIIFSSFNPEVCLLLSLKQPSIPILFLTESGSSYMPDIRCGSLQSAVRFSKKWNLLGIVSASEPIVKCPRLAQVVKSSGLVCFTYGVLNNEPENSKLQMLSGVDAVIVDNVLAVRKGLTKEGKEGVLEEDILAF